MGDKNRKQYLRRMAVSSICAIVLCLACAVPATLALFAVEMTNEGNVFEVGQFQAQAAAVEKQAVLAAEEVAVVIPCETDTLCPEGSYTLQVSWTGNVSGHIKVSMSYAAEEKKTVAPAVYAIDLPAVEGEDPYWLQIPMTLYEDAMVTVESSWGSYEAAEGENAMVLSTDLNAENSLDQWLLKTNGIFFGTPFVGAVTLGTDAIGEDEASAVAYEPGTYTLNVTWTPGFAGYCVLDFYTAEEGSDTAALKRIIKLPKADTAENAVLAIPLTLYEKTRITAVTGKGSPDNGENWPENGTIDFGSRFLAVAYVGKEGGEYAELSETAYEAGTYQLKLDWSKATADGWCKLTVGEDVYYFTCPEKAADANDDTCLRYLKLELLQGAAITLTTGKGALPEGATALDSTVESVVYGAEFNLTAAIGKLTEGAETVYGELPKETLEAGTYELKLDWSASNVAGYCLITVGDTEYYLACPTGETMVQTVKLQLEEAATVTVTCAEGAYSGNAAPVSETGIVLKKAEAESGSETIDNNN